MHFKRVKLPQWWWLARGKATHHRGSGGWMPPPPPMGPWIPCVRNSVAGPKQCCGSVFLFWCCRLPGPKQWSETMLRVRNEIFDFVLEICVKVCFLCFCFILLKMSCWCGCWFSLFRLLCFVDFVLFRSFWCACSERHPEQPIYTIVRFFCHFSIPLHIFCICFGGLVNKIWKRWSMQYIHVKANKKNKEL